MKSQSKQEIRNYIRNIKKAMTECEISDKSMKIEKILTETKEYREADNIYIYISYNQEVVTNGIIRKSLEEGKNVFVPKVHEDKIRFHQIFSLEADVLPGAFGIMEPKGDIPDESREGLMIMPGIAFDRQFHRIGYGGGFYDRYLAMPNSHIKMAVAYDFQIMDSIPVDELDMEVDIIITENEVIRKQDRRIRSLN